MFLDETCVGTGSTEASVPAGWEGRSGSLEVETRDWEGWEGGERQVSREDACRGEAASSESQLGEEVSRSGRKEGRQRLMMRASLPRLSAASVPGGQERGLAKRSERRRAGLLGRAGRRVRTGLRPSPAAEVRPRWEVGSARLSFLYK